MSEIGVLILAGGASTRLGQRKQLLLYQGKPLLQHMVQVALASGCQPVRVVLGAYAETIVPHLANLDIHITYNDQWQLGMASSIRCGLQAMWENMPDLEAIVLMVCDQPFVTPDLLRQLIAGYHHSQCPIVASEYASTLGVPALFHKTFFPALSRLQGDVGAKSIIRQHLSDCLSIPFAAGAIDLDTPENLSILSENF